jgi:hypothetical protein
MPFKGDITVKLRIWPVVLTMVISSTLLFGGWFTYREWVIQKPLNKLVTEYTGVNSVKLKITTTQVDMKLNLKPGTDLGGLMRHIERDGRKILGNRQVKFDIEDHSSIDLDKVWEQALFSVAQAMENRQYTDITTAMKELESQHNNVTAKAEMDDKNVYITLTSGDNSKYIILPRVPQKLGVWSNA